MNVSSMRLKRAGVLAGFVGMAVVAGLVAPATASAAAPIGANPGHLILTPGSGAMASKPTWATDTACAAPFQADAKLVLVETSGQQLALAKNVSTAGTSVTTAFQGTPLLGNLSQFVGTGNLQNGGTYELVVLCLDGTGTPSAQQSTFLTISADGANYTTSATAPVGAKTTTQLSANPTTATQGSPVALSATVTSTNTPNTDAVGTVEFDNGAISLGTAPVNAGVATLSVSNLPLGTSSLTAKFIPTDSTKFGGSTSAGVPVTITNAPPPAGAETINVKLGDVTTGTLSLTVDNATPVTLSQPVNAGADLEGKGALNNVTVNDNRLPTHFGWNLTGAVSDFSDGTDTFTGNALGWTPKIVTANAANDVTVGGAIASNNPGLKTPAAFASAGAGKGFGNTVLSADLDLHVPFTQAAGQYTATETNTLLSN